MSSTPETKEPPITRTRSRTSSTALLPLGIVPYDTDNTVYWFGRQLPKVDLDAIATQPSVFDDAASRELYCPSPDYENAHRFDPDARWTWREERALVRRIDYKIMIWVFVMFFALDLDRTNISQANADNFLDDLKLTTDDFNLGNTVFKLAFLCSELPSQLVSKRLGPDVWIPIQMCTWSVVAMSQFWLNGKSSFVATRILLGLMQGGFIPDIILYLSYFYTKRELPIRLIYFWMSNYASHIVSAFLATGILRMRGLGHYAGWRYLFLIEGGFTFFIGVFSFFLMPPGPTQTKAPWRPKGWFTEREEVIMVNRILRDDPYKSSMHNREGLNPKQIWGAIKDWGSYPLYIIGLFHLIPVAPPQVYLTLSLRALGFSTTSTNLLSIPSVVIGGVTSVLAAYLSERINSRVFVCVLLQFWVLPLLCALYTFNKTTTQWVYFSVVTLIAAYPYTHPIQVAWASRTSGGVRTRTVSASLYNISVQLGGIIASNIYRTDDQPLYRRGNRILIGITCMNIAIYGLTYLFYREANRRRDKIWKAWTKEEQEHYLATTKDEGNRRLDFRFAY